MQGNVYDGKMMKDRRTVHVNTQPEDIKDKNIAEKD